MSGTGLDVAGTALRVGSRAPTGARPVPTSVELIDHGAVVAAGELEPFAGDDGYTHRARLTVEPLTCGRTRTLTSTPWSSPRQVRSSGWWASVRLR